MKVILLSELKGKGGEGDVVEVARGFFNNYLGPQGIAVLATKGNLKQLEDRKGAIARREAERIANATALKQSLENKKVFIAAKVGDEGVLFGSVTAQIIADAVEAQLGVEIDRKRLELGNPIKVAGEHVVTLSIYRDIKATINLTVGEAPAVEEPAEAPAEEAAEEIAE